jgi:hypothetical protein
MLKTITEEKEVKRSASPDVLENFESQRDKEVPDMEEILRSVFSVMSQFG